MKQKHWSIALRYRQSAFEQPGRAVTIFEQNTFVWNSTFLSSAGRSLILLWSFKWLVILFIAFLVHFSNIVVVLLEFLVSSVLVLMVYLVYVLHVFDIISDIFAIMVVELVEIFVRHMAPLRCWANDHEDGASNCRNENPVVHAFSQIGLDVICNS